MRLLLLNPPSRQTVLRDYYCSSASKAGYLWHPIDLLAQSALLSSKHDLRVLDAVAEGMSNVKAEKLIANFAPEAVFALTSAATWRDDFHFLETLKRKNGFKLVLSGEIFMADVKAVLESNPWIDAVLLSFIGTDLAQYLDGSTEHAANFAWRDGNKIHVVRTKAKGNYTLGIPRHDLFRMVKYRMPWQPYHPFATVITDYGCPFGCSFCNSHTFGYALRDLNDLHDELSWLSGRGIRQLFIKDMTFAASRPHAMAVLEMMIKEKWGFSWNAYCRADLIDSDLAQMMCRAGCRLVQIGVESADSNLLAQHGKKISASTAREAFDILKSAGINAGAHFIMGLPGDTLDGIRRTVELAIGLDPIYASFNIAMPRLGASLDDSNWMDRPLDSSGIKPFFKLDDLSSDALVKERNRALRRFYFRPIYWAKALGAIKTPYQLWNLIYHAGGFAINRLKENMNPN